MLVIVGFGPTIWGAGGVHNQLIGIELLDESFKVRLDPSAPRWEIIGNEKSSEHVYILCGASPSVVCRTSVSLLAEVTTAAACWRPG